MNLPNNKPTITTTSKGTLQIIFNKNERTRVLGILGIALGLVFSVPFVTYGEEWKYQVLAQDQVIKADARGVNAKSSLLEFKSIDVGGFRTARVFIHVLETDFAKNQGKFTSNSKLRVTCFHKLKMGSIQYFDQEIPMRFATYLGGWVEIPIIGPELRLIVWGESIPKQEMTANCTIYLLK